MSLKRTARLLEATKPLPFDRVLDRRTSSQIVDNMERLARCPEAAVERDRFYARVAQADRAARVRADINEALETISIELLEAK